MKLIDSIIRQPARVSFGRTSESSDDSTAAVALDSSRDADSVTVTAADGSFVVVPGATGSVAGILTAADKSALAAAAAAGQTYESKAAVEAALVPAGPGMLRTAGYAAPGDGGGALYRRTATQPAHAGKVQSADGAWWELLPELNGYNVCALGADRTGTADSTAAFADALAISGHITGPLGTYEVRNLDLSGNWMGIRLAGSTLTNTAGDGTALFRVAATAHFSNTTIEAGLLKVASGGGPVFDFLGQMAHVKIVVDRIQQFADDSIITNANEAALGDGRMYFVTWRVARWYPHPDNTVPAISWQGRQGTLNATEFLGGRMDGMNGVWCVVDQTSGAARSTGVRFVGQMLERIDKGWLKLRGVANWEIVGVTTFDNQNNVLAAPFVELLDATSGPDCYGVHIKGFMSTKTTLAAGVADISVGGSLPRGILIEHCGRDAGDDFTIDLNGRRGVSVVNCWNTLIRNDDHRNSHFNISGPDGIGVKTPGIALSGSSDSASSAETVSAGAITYGGQGILYVAAEGGAASDDLDTIHKGSASDGQILVLQNWIGSQNIVVKHGTGNIYTKSKADVTLDNAQDMIMLIYSPRRAGWVEA